MSTPSAPTLGERWRFSSSMLPEAERFNRYLEEFSRRIIRIDAERIGDNPFCVDLEMMPLGSAVCTVERITPGHYGRTQPLLTDGNDDLVLFVNLGAPYIEPGGSTVESGGIHLLDSSRAGQITATSDSNVLMLAVARKLLLSSAPHAEDLAHGPIAQSPEVSLLLRHYGLSLINAGSLPQRLALLAGNHLVDLMSLALGARGEAEDTASKGGLRAARFHAVCEYVLQNLHDPDLSLSAVARQNQLSERYIQRLFEETGTSFTEFVIEQRLMQAYRMLAAPGLRYVRIVDIASECGFGDLSNFNRAFRRRFAVTPRDVRKG